MQTTRRTKSFIYMMAAALLVALAFVALQPGTGLLAPKAAGSPGEPIVIEHELGTTTLPKTPERVIVFDFGTLDSLDYLGVDIVGLPKTNIPSYLSHYNSAEYANVGSLTEPDFERIYALKPDLIIISGRQSAHYDEMSRIAPTVYFGIDTNHYMASFEQNARNVGRIFGKEAEVEARLTDIQTRIEEVRETVSAQGANALITLVNDTSLSAFGPGSRFGLIHDVLGFPPVDRTIVSSTHGQTISFEFILTKDPDYLFVVDRSQALGERTTSVRAVVENQLVRFTKAYKNDRIVYLNPEYWYLSGGGLISMSKMVEDIEAVVQ